MYGTVYSTESSIPSGIPFVTICHRELSFFTYTITDHSGLAASIPVPQALQQMCIRPLIAFPRELQRRGAWSSWAAGSPTSSRFKRQSLANRTRRRIQTLIICSLQPDWQFRYYIEVDRYDILAGSISTYHSARCSVFTFRPVKMTGTDFSSFHHTKHMSSLSLFSVVVLIDAQHWFCSCTSTRLPTGDINVYILYLHMFL